MFEKGLEIEAFVSVLGRQEGNRKWGSKRYLER